MNRRLSPVTFLAVMTLVLGACSASNSETVVDATVATDPTTQAPASTRETSPSTTEAPLPTTEAPEAVTLAEVVIESFAFGPSVIEIGVGDTVVWTNKESSVGHTTVANDGSWQSALLSPGKTFEQVFDRPGTYTYFCSIHPSMTASVVVNG